MKNYLSVCAMVCFISFVSGCHPQEESRVASTDDFSSRTNHDVRDVSQELVAVAGILEASNRESIQGLSELLRSDNIEFYVYGSRGKQIYVSAEDADQAANIIRVGIKIGRITDVALLPDFEGGNKTR